MESHIVIVTPADVFRFLFDWLPGDNDWMIPICIITAVTSLPLALRMVPPNPVYGFRTSFTRSSPEVWYDANAFAGRATLAASVVSAFMLMAGLVPRGAPWGSVAVVLVPIAIATLAMWLYLRHLRETLQRR